MLVRTRPGGGNAILSAGSCKSLTFTSTSSSQTTQNQHQPQPAANTDGRAGGSIGQQLNGLLEGLRQLQSSAEDNLAEIQLADCQSTRKLIETIKRRLCETERLILGESGLDSASGGAGQAGAVAQPTANQAVAGSSRSSLMRYSTPNLLLSSNFEHILRQRDKVSEDHATSGQPKLHPRLTEAHDDRARRTQRAKQEEEELRRAPIDGPPEATEAWFLSRSPAGGRHSPSLSGLSCGSGLVAQQQQPSLRGQTNRQPSYSSRESINVGFDLAGSQAGKTLKGE